MAIELITEVANSHQGNISLLKKIITNFFEVGAKSIKFQIYFAEDFLTKNHERFLHFKKQSFSENEWKQIIAFTRKKGFRKIYADVLGIKAFILAKKLNVDGYKIHSTDLNNDNLLEKVSLENKKIFLSVGGAKIFEIDHALNFFKNSPIKPILMHGFQSYPTKIEDVNLNFINFLKKNFGNKCEYGYQDHLSGASKLGLYMSLISLGTGIKYLERHVTLNRKEKGVDYYSSIEPKEYKILTKILNLVNKGLLEKTNSFSESEDVYRKTTKKFWITKKNLIKGSKIKLNDLEFKRINNKNREPLILKEILNKKIIVNLKKESIICNSHFKKKVCVTIVARYDSKRLPGKAAIKINNLSLLDILIKRVKKSKLIDNLIFCTTKNSSDDVLCDIASRNNISVFRGFEKNVLGRIIAATEKNKPDIIIRVTGDDILVDPNYMDQAIKFHLENNLDYTDHKRLPSGTETEVFNRNTLNFINLNAKDNSGTEYLTYYIKKNEFLFRTGSAPVVKKHNKKIRLTIDNSKDLNFVKPFLKKMILMNKIDSFNLDDVVNFYGNKKNIQKKISKNLDINTELKTFYLDYL